MAILNPNTLIGITNQPRNWPFRSEFTPSKCPPRLASVVLGGAAGVNMG
jgi:hypothetical protein